MCEDYGLDAASGSVYGGEVRMGKLTKEQQARNDGMALALRIAEKDGIDGLREEIRRRGLQNYSLNVPQKELDKAKTVITQRTIDMVMAIGCLTLHDEFGFSQKRLQRWIDRFMSKCSGLCDPDAGVTEMDYLQALKDETGITLTISRGL